MQWFLELMEELEIDCQVGHPAKIRAAEPRKQKHDRRDAALVLQLLVETRFPSIWMPSREQRDVRSLILYRHQWVRIRTRVQSAKSIAVTANNATAGPYKVPDAAAAPPATRATALGTGTPKASAKTIKQMMIYPWCTTKESRSFIG